VPLLRAAHLRQINGEGCGFREGHAGIDRPVELLEHICSCVYDPSYPQYA